MGCPGGTTYNALRHTKALPGDRVAVLGVGGLGHLGLQFARAMGFETIAINRGTAKKDDALKLGAHHYVDATDGDVIPTGVPPEPLAVSPLQLITPGLSIVGHPSGTAREIEDTMHFAVLSGVRAWIEELPLAQAAEGYAALEEGRAHYRTVLTV